LKSRDEDDDSNVQIQNIYGIPNENEKLQMQAKDAKKKKAASLQAKKDNMKALFQSFSKTLKEADFDAAMKVKTDLIENEEQNATALDKIKINTTDLFRHSFEFAEVAKNDFSTEALEELEIAERNLNSNMDNVDLFNTFVETAE